MGLPIEAMRVCRGRENVVDAITLEEQRRREVCMKSLIKV